MKSIFHTSATTAEELRAEIVSDLDRRIETERYSKQWARTIKERMVAEGRIRLLQDLANFWTDLAIDDQPPSPSL